MTVPNLDFLNVNSALTPRSLKVLQQNTELLQNGITEEQRKKAYYPRVSESIFHNINPFGYSGHDDEIKQAVSDMLFRKDIPAENKWGIMGKERLDSFSLYLGLPQKHGTFRVSNYSPERSKEDVTYFSMPKYTEGISNPESIKNAVEALIQAKQDKSTYKNGVGLSTEPDKFKIEVKKAKDKGIIDYDESANVMGNYKVSLGKDKKGNYISYYDKWDLNPTENTPSSDPNYLTALTRAAGLGVKMIGHPFEIYDRIYYDPKTYKPIK